MNCIPKVPSSLIKQLVPKGSAKVTPDGISIKVINTIAPVAVDEIPPNIVDKIEIKIDGIPIQLEKLKIMMREKQFSFVELQQILSQPICLGDSIIITYPEPIFQPGVHSIDFTINVADPIIVSAEIEFGS